MAEDMRLFDILGPVMIGPSSSHTAGAARIGRVTRRLLGEEVVKADVLLTGSFAATYAGHGTDRAIIGGLMDMNVDDMRIRESPSLAKEAGMEISFRTGELADAHPNTAQITAEGPSGQVICVTAASIGGGRIRVVAIDGLPLSFTGEKNTYIIWHKDAPGAVALVGTLLAAKSVNIASMRVSRLAQGGEAVMVIEVDAADPADNPRSLSVLPGITRAVYLHKLD
ncbi:MAG: L-serine ammonia-lyase, iron-sulfur-dependent subunit beta [Eubacteriales bacterium]|nr:L-serine ammonia-lyase, iron-sulfur-dependent subunit beta [Eubacteriales bacterium]